MTESKPMSPACWYESQWLALLAGGALLGAAMKRGSAPGSALAAAGGMLLYRGLTRKGPSRLDRRPAFARGVRVEASVVVRRSPEECYRFWRRLENLPTFMSHIHSVEVQSRQRSHWKANIVGGLTVEWDAEIVHDTPNQTLGWRSLPGSTIETAGSVRFIPKGHGRTEVRVRLRYEPPGGAVASALSELMMLFGDSPRDRIQQDLQRFKETLEGSRNDQRVEVASEDSFPASDPPAWAPARV